MMNREQFVKFMKDTADMGKVDGLGGCQLFIKEETEALKERCYLADPSMGSQIVASFSLDALYDIYRENGMMFRVWMTLLYGYTMCQRDAAVAA